MCRFLRLTSVLAWPRTEYYERFGSPTRVHRIALTAAARTPERKPAQDVRGYMLPPASRISQANWALHGLAEELRAYEPNLITIENNAFGARIVADREIIDQIVGFAEKARANRAIRERRWDTDAFNTISEGEWKKEWDKTLAA